LANKACLSAHFEPPENAVDAPAVIHLSDQMAVAFRFFLGGFDNMRDLVELLAGNTDQGANPVAHSPRFGPYGNFP
jgi:hypothetical protein